MIRLTRSLTPLSLTAVSLIVLTACATTGQAATSTVLATAPLATADGHSAGRAELVTSGDQIRLHLTASGLPAGTHGAHLHTTGRCDAPGFASAGGHLNPAGHQHGTENPAGPHLGDLPNLIVKADGTGELTVPVSVARADSDARVFDTDGTAIVIHAGPDDYKTDPSGNSGGRIACGVFARP